MARIFVCALVFTCFLGALASDTWDSQGVKLVLRLYDECTSNSDGFSPCLKKKALTFLNRLGRMDKLSLTEGVAVVKSPDAPVQEEVTDEQLENTLPRASDAKEAALDKMLMDKLASFVSSRTLQVTMPKINAQDLSFEEGIYIFFLTFYICFIDVQNWIDFFPNVYIITKFYFII